MHNVEVGVGMDSVDLDYAEKNDIKVLFNYKRF